MAEPCTGAPQVMWDNLIDGRRQLKVPLGGIGVPLCKFSTWIECRNYSIGAFPQPTI
jgi:hypothetical protein